MVEASDHRSIRDDLDTGEALQATQPAQKEALLFVSQNKLLVHHAGQAVVKGGTFDNEPGSSHDEAMVAEWERGSSFFFINDLSLYIPLSQSLLLREIDTLYSQPPYSKTPMRKVFKLFMNKVASAANRSDLIIP